MSTEVAVADHRMRFPVERRARPTLHLMRELAPDARDVCDVLDLFHLTDPALPARERAAADVAACVQDFDASDNSALVAALSGVLASLVSAAVGICWLVQDAFAASVEARRRLSRAQASGEGWRARLRARAETANQEWASLLLDAYGQAEGAEVVARALDVARLDQSWVPAAVQTEPAHSDPVAVVASRATPLARS